MGRCQCRAVEVVASSWASRWNFASFSRAAASSALSFSVCGSNHWAVCCADGGLHFDCRVDESGEKCVCDLGGQDRLRVTCI